MIDNLPRKLHTFPAMNHLVFTVSNGFVSYRMNERQGSHPLGDDSAHDVIDYLKRIIKNFSSCEVIFS